MAVDDVNDCDRKNALGVDGAKEFGGKNATGVGGDDNIFGFKKGDGVDDNVAVANDDDFHGVNDSKDSDGENGTVGGDDDNKCAGEVTDFVDDKDAVTKDDDINVSDDDMKGAEDGNSISSVSTDIDSDGRDRDIMDDDEDSNK